MRTCVLCPDPEAPSVTFIRAHLERLPGEVFCLCGGYLPERRRDGRPLLRETLWTRMSRFLGCGRGRVARLEHALERFLRDEQVDVVLAEFGPTASAALPACERAGVPLVAHFHGFDAWQEETLRAETAGYARLFRRAAAVVSVSREMSARLESLGAPAGRLHLIPYGVDPARFRPGDPGAAPPLFVAVGRLIPKKGPDRTLRAFHAARARVPDARLVLIGDGPLAGRCRELVAELGLAEAVELRGAAPAGAVAAALRGARAFVQHSLQAPDGDREGTPVAVLEAGASGLPVVATRHAGIGDVVVDGETGLLVEEGDVAGMAEALVQLARDPGRARTMGRAARARVLEHFTLDRSIARLAGVLEGAVRPKAIKPEAAWTR